MTGRGSPARRTARRVVALLVVGAVGAAIWVGVRALLAREELGAALPLAAELRGEIEAGDSARMRATLAELGRRTSSARELTGDPVWRVAERIPGVGANLSAVRRSAETVDALVREASPVVVQLSASDPADFLPRDGVVDVAAIRRVSGPLDEAQAAVERARASIAAIDASGTLPVVADAVGRLRDALDETGSAVGGAAAAARLLPAMLGTGEPREYLLLVQNNAELRAAGGIPGAIVLVRAEAGGLTLEAQASASSFRLAEPILPLTAEESTLYGSSLGMFMQNVTATPDFARTAELAVAIWRTSHPGRIDGVIAVDPVVLAGVLTSTGPVEVGDGTRLTSSNAVDRLLSGVYRDIPDPAEQDAFFARAATAVFERLTTGGLDAGALIQSLARSADERRVLVWSPRASEEEALRAAGLAGEPPVSDASMSAFGVYLDDNTEGKMDVYLRADLVVSGAACRADDRPDFELTVALRSEAPSDAAARLPDRVTGGRPGLGVAKGQIRTTVFLFAPVGSSVYDVRADGSSLAFIAADDAAASVAGVTVTLDPGEETQVTFHLVGPPGATVEATVEHTPMATPVPVRREGLRDCPTPAPPGQIVALAPPGVPG